MNRLPFIAVLLLLPSTAIGQEIRKDRTYPPFALGVTGIVATIEPGYKVTVQDTLKNSPAHGNLQKGDVLLMINGADLSVADPRVPLGQVIGKAEGKDGKLSIAFRRGESKMTATIRIQALGANSPTWPIHCAKSKKIIAETATFLVSVQREDGAYKLGKRYERDGLSGCLCGLFLLSTGDAKYLPNVKRQARGLAENVKQRPTGSTWHLGYQGILLAEYYLKTGDKAVLPGLQSLCDKAIQMQNAGAWGHGAGVNPGYVQSGLMNSAGIPVLTTLILGRECGVDVDEKAYLRSLKFFYRMAGHGCICYGDHRSELWWPNTNGRNAMLACSFSLLEEDRFQKAAKHLAVLVADSYYKPEFGHTGGGFNVMWRGLGSIHVPKSRQSHYHRQMNQLAWYYDLCRQPGGGFSMLPTPPDNSRYSGLAWGTGAVALTYTAPLKTLRITGAPRSKYSVPYRKADFAWGTKFDMYFLETEDAEGFDQETTPPHEVYDLLIGKNKNKATVAFCAQHLCHYSPLVRTWTAKWLKEHINNEVLALLTEAVAHDDPRVRRAAYDCISGYDNWGRPMRSTISRAVVSKTFLPAILKTLNNPKSAWWEVDGALFALGKAEPEDIRNNLPLIKKFAKHEDWYLREGAFWALDGLREFINAEEFERLANIYADESAVFARSSFDAGFRVIAKSPVLKLEPETMADVAKILGPTLHKAKTVEGYDVMTARHEAAHRTMMILKHFDPEIYQYMTDDIEIYLKTWQPYYQHSVWLISGSPWQPGFLKVLEHVGPKGKSICRQLKRIAANYDTFDKKRTLKNGRAELRQAIQQAVAAWEKKFGRVNE